MYGISIGVLKYRIAIRQMVDANVLRPDKTQLGQTVLMVTKRIEFDLMRQGELKNEKSF